MLFRSRYVCALRLDRTPFERAARSRPKNSQALSSARSACGGLGVDKLIVDRIAIDLARAVPQLRDR